MITSVHKLPTCKRKSIKLPRTWQISLSAFLLFPCLCQYCIHVCIVQTYTYMHAFVRTYVQYTYTHTYTHACTHTRAHTRAHTINLVTFQVGIDFGNETRISLPHSRSSKVTLLPSLTNVPVSAGDKKATKGLFVYSLVHNFQSTPHNIQSTPHNSRSRAICKAGKVHNHEHTATCTFKQQQTKPTHFSRERE